MEYKLTMEQKLAELHQLVSFVSRKRIHIENNMQFLDTYTAFRYSKEACAKVYLDEDFFINSIEEDTVDESFVDNHLEMFFVHNETLNKIIELMQTVDQDSKSDISLRMADGMEELLNNEANIDDEETMKKLWEELKLN